MIVEAPLPWAVISPPLVIVRTLTLSDCQFEHVAMTFCEVPSAKVPIGVVCAVSPLDFIASALRDNVTDCNVCELVPDGDVGAEGEVGVEAEGPVGKGEWLSQAAMQTPRTKTRRTRFTGMLLEMCLTTRREPSIRPKAALV